MPRKKIALIFGTRPEAIKMAPLIRELLAHQQTYETKVCVSGQHREMLAQAMDIFGIIPDHDLQVMTSNQTLAVLTCNLLNKVTDYLTDEKPDLVLIHGDTTTSFATALACFYLNIPIGHVEAGLRTSDVRSPFPEEFNRRVSGLIADLHFAPTDSAARNLRKEGANPENIHTTGNTIVDALNIIRRTVLRDQSIIQTFEDKYGQLFESRDVALVTMHRRENFSGGLRNICGAIYNLLKNNERLAIILPVHLNPKVRETIYGALGGKDLADRALLVDPVDYVELLYIMSRCSFIMTDSGGIQEEAPSFGKYVFVLREKTERPEACEAGFAELVGSNPETIEKQVTKFLKSAWAKRQTPNNPYGDGGSAARIREAIDKFFLFQRHSDEKS